MSSKADVAGRPILVVEDEVLVAMLIEDALARAGLGIVGPASSVAMAMDLLRRECIDGAVLDVRLDDSDVFPVADELMARGIPFLFVTGYGAPGVAEHYRDRPVLQKPFRPAELERLVLQMLGPA